MLENNMLRMLIGALVGAVVGYLFYRFIGCRGGACPMTGNRYLTPAIWAFIGAILARGGH